MSKIKYLEDVKVLKKKHRLLKKVSIFVLLISIVGVMVIVADVFSSFLTLNNYVFNYNILSSTTNLTKKVYLLSFGKETNQNQSEILATKVAVQGGAGYVWEQSGVFYVIGQLYLDNSSAQNVKTNMQSTGYTLEVKEIIIKFDVNIDNLEKEDNNTINTAINYIFESITQIYNICVNLDKSSTTNIIASSKINSIKSEHEVYISRLQELFSRVPNDKILKLKNIFIKLKDSLDSTMLKLLQGGNVNYNSKYGLCDYVCLNYNLFNNF